MRDLERDGSLEKAIGAELPRNSHILCSQVLDSTWRPATAARGLVPSPRSTVLCAGVPCPESLRLVLGKSSMGMDRDVASVAQVTLSVPYSATLAGITLGGDAH
jgi:hypothetical protein